MNCSKIVHFFIIYGLLVIPAITSFAQADSTIQEKIYYYPNGKISSKGSIINTKPHGIWVTYYPDGTVKSTGEWNNGLLNGLWQFFDFQGNIQNEINYLNNKKNGYSIEYQLIKFKGKNEVKLKSKELFDNGERVGKGFYFSSNGCLEFVKPFLKGKYNGQGYKFTCDTVLVKLLHFTNGNLVEEEIVNQLDSLGNPTGKWLKLYNTFDVKEEINYLNGEKHGWYKFFKTNGDIASLIYFQNGEIHESKDSKYFDLVEYNDTSGVKIKGFFLGKTPVGLHIQIDSAESNCFEYDTAGSRIGYGKCSQNGNRMGEWFELKNSGKIFAKGLYKNNLKNGEWIYFFENCNVEQQGNYVNGKEHGKWLWYSEDGNKRKEENFRYGLREGQYFEFDEKSNVVVKGNFVEGEEDGYWETRIGDIVWKGFYIFGELNGPVNSFYLNGQKYFEGNFTNGYQQGKQQYFYVNGQVKEEEFWESGERVGTWKKYNDDGSVIISVTYRNGKEYLINGVRVKY